MSLMNCIFLKLERGVLFDYYILEKDGKKFSINRNEIEITNIKSIFNELKKLNIRCAYRTGRSITSVFNA